VAQAVNAQLSGDAETIITDVTHDSRKASAGSLFVAIRGERFDAHDFIPDVMARGAAGVISAQPAPKGFAGAWLQVAQARKAQAVAADVVQGQPSRQLKLVGLTGTNGKTTCAYLITAMCEAAGLRTAMMTTVEFRVGDKRGPAAYTTPEASDTQRFLRQAVDAGCGVAVMESSSQALDLYRCDNLHYSVAAFTNLTRDHLDYHKTMEAYGAAKKRLFDGSLGSFPDVSVINVGDAYGAELAAEIRAAGRRVTTYALDKEADITAADARETLAGMEFTLHTPMGVCAAQTPLVGRPHLYNLLTATGVALALGCGLDDITRAMRTCGGAPGRFETVPHTGDFTVVVDYAHTDDALANVLRAARAVAAGRIITVFGCGGDRDRAKRPVMGRIAGELSDIVIATSDNPRTEDPEQILDDVEVGLRETGRAYERIADRRAAIHRAVAQANTGDLVLIAGKGHEDYQIIGREKIHFDDREVAREILP
jgi:UDP-N-acetylmuramoyl-L-alanyl-D-glutamate--2,6-diaminopimelate ligase